MGRRTLDEVAVGTDQAAVGDVDVDAKARAKELFGVCCHPVMVVDEAMATPAALPMEKREAFDIGLKGP